MDSIQDNKNHIFEFNEIVGNEMLEEVRLLFKEYSKSINIDLSFQNFEEELNSLPGQYAPPEGTLIIALVDGNRAGCVALRKISEGICEMKRLFVRDEYRGLGIGKMLISMAIESASKLNYKYIRLDTIGNMKEAVNLYNFFGFYEIEPYNSNPIEDARYMELKLES